MLRQLLVTGLLLATLAGCTKLEGTCSNDSDCAGVGGVCDTSAGVCYEKDKETDDCAPACPAYQACVSTVCMPRFTGVTFLNPAQGAGVLGGTMVEVRAQLVADPAHATPPQFPPTLTFSASRAGGGDVGSFGAVTQNGDTYTAQWTIPSAEAQFTLTAVYPEASVSGSVNVQVDNVAPSLAITVPDAPARATGSATQAEEKDSDPLYAKAFRRDESVTLTVSANEPVTGVTLTVFGIASGGGVGQAQAPVEVTAGGTCGGGPAFCGTATVNLSGPEMHAFRGTMELRAEGRDAAGNLGSGTGGVQVTRWKWAFDAAGTILGTPAVGNRGNVYLGTSVAGNGKTLAIAPEGVRKWEFLTGDVLGSPAVGEYSSNEENVYVAAKTSSNVPTFYALRGVAGTERQRCTYNGTNDLPSAVAVGMTQGTLGLVETGVTIHNAGQVRIVELRPAGAIATECIEVTGSSIPASVGGGAVVLKGQNVFYGTADFRVTSYDLATGSNAPRTGFPQDTAYLARGLALSGTILYGAASSTDNPAQGSLFSIPVAGGSFENIYPGATATSRVFNLAIGNSDLAYFGAETASSKELLSRSLTTAGATPIKVANVGTLRGAPVVAKNDFLYTFNTQGRLSAWMTSTLAPLWDVEIAPGPGTADVSPTVDCRRDGLGQAVAGLGTLYVPAATKLYAVVVDSAGLDPNAAWPKFQHDVRNTGNPDTPVTSCP